MDASKSRLCVLFQMLLSPLMNKVLEEVFDMELALWPLAFKYQLSLNFSLPVVVYSLQKESLFLLCSLQWS